VAYSVHDFEDAIVNGYVDPRSLGSPATRAEVLAGMGPWVGDIPPARVEAAWDRLHLVFDSVATYLGTRRDLGVLKNLTSTLIGRFAVKAELESEGGVATLAVPGDTRDEITLLKGIVAIHVMSHTARQPLYLHQRGVLKSLAQAMLEDPTHLDAVFSEDYSLASSDSDKKRVIVDQVASLTDQSAMVLYDRLGFA
jgi:dGTPase